MLITIIFLLFYSISALEVWIGRALAADAGGCLNGDGCDDLNEKRYVIKMMICYQVFTQNIIKQYASTACIWRDVYAVL